MTTLPERFLIDSHTYVRADVVERLIREARRQERERCAAVCDGEAGSSYLGVDPDDDMSFADGAYAGSMACARRIRALTDDDTEEPTP